MTKANEDRYRELLKKPLSLYATGAEKQVLLDELVRVKQELTDNILAANRASSVIDAIASNVWPQAQWRYDPVKGWTFADAASDQPWNAEHRKQRALEVARALLQETRINRVKSRAIAERLQAEGDPTQLADLSTAVGNVLSRSNEWQRIAPGEYHYRAAGMQT